ncbi:hypothetical protein [Allokutzneria albata]|uniref:Uncharacterized protein n=1 Tax=Allokutzneria albata TaxID=211114 RepID=A0A1G9XA98_ALLAB|nr:hypothetical protein [Allokutzneria albata]SDM93729.1 hypothetical protein SAMN04489726_4088 [Allokutzneria albata]
MRTFTKRALGLVAATAVGTALVLGAAPAASAGTSHVKAGAAVHAAAKVEGKVTAIVGGYATIKTKAGASVKVRLAGCVVIGKLRVGVHVRLGVNLLGIRVLVVL